MTRYESDCESKRLKAFSIENSYMKHKRQNSNNNIELIQNNSYAWCFVFNLILIIYDNINILSELINQSNK